MVGAMHTVDVIREILTQALAPLALEIEDDSARHRGHAGAAAGGGHYGVYVVSAAFEGKGLVARHRLVYDALAEQMKGPIHALALRTLTPAEAARPGA